MRTAGRCDAVLSPEDGDINLDARRVVILHPGTQVEEAGDQQVEGRHQHSHKEQIRPLRIFSTEVGL